MNKRICIKWDIKMLQDVASQYHTRFAFKKGNRKAYKAAIRMGVLQEICQHMPRLAQLKWTRELVTSIALKYSTRMEFSKKDHNAYNAAQEMGILQEICSHMPINAKKIWTLDEIKKAALNFKTRWAFQKNETGAYVAAYRKGIIDKVCSHMPITTTGSSAEEELYHIVKHIFDDTIKFIDRKVMIKGKPFIQGFHIDIFIPSKNAGIEYDGTYHHSFQGLKRSRSRQKWPDEDIRNYHQIKDDYFMSKGIKILHIKEKDWIKNKEKCIKQVFKFLGVK